ncbi:MAG: cell division ATP-binding protein FtsE [Faecalibacterium sp.]
MIKFEHVTKTFPGGQHALKDVSVEIKQGEFVYVLGHSGAGKSTFLKMILLETTPTSGKVIVNGEDFSRLKKRNIPYRRRQIGVVFQDFRLIDNMTVYENVAFAMRVTNISEKVIKKRVPYVLDLVRLADKKDNYPRELSGGEQQRVAIARAVVHSPKLIIADEPTGNIDPELSFEMMELLTAINSVGITVVVVTHEHDLVSRFQRRVITLDHGRVVGDSEHILPVLPTEEDGILVETAALEQALALGETPAQEELEAQAEVASADAPKKKAAAKKASAKTARAKKRKGSAQPPVPKAEPMPEPVSVPEPEPELVSTSTAATADNDARLEMILQKALQEAALSQKTVAAPQEPAVSEQEEAQHETV